MQSSETEYEGQQHFESPSWAGQVLPWRSWIGWTSSRFSRVSSRAFGPSLKGHEPFRQAERFTECTQKDSETDLKGLSELLFRFNSVLSSVRSTSRARALRVEMRQRGLKEDIYSYNASGPRESAATACERRLMGLCERLKLWPMALELLEEMPSQQVLPDVVTFSSAMAACEKARDSVHLRS